MNTPPLMDKQTMDLIQGAGVGGGTSLPQLHAQTKDFIDLIDRTGINFYQRQKQADDDNYRIIDDQKYINTNRMNKDDNVPVHDFKPIRSMSGSGGAVFKYGTSDLKSSTSDPAIGKYGSLDSLESPKVILKKEKESEKDRNTLDATIVSEINQTLKKHTDDLLNVLEGVSSRLTQLESRTRHLENAVDDLKVSVGTNHGSTDGKMRHLENILREVLAGVQILKDKQDIVEGHLQLEKSQASKVNQKLENHSPGHVDPAHHVASAPQQSQQQLLAQVNLPYSLTVPLINDPHQPPTQQGIPPLAQFPNQLPQNQVSSIPHREPYLIGHGQTHDSINQQIPSLGQQSHALPRAPSPQLYQQAPPPQYSHPTLPSHNASHLHPPSVNHSEETNVPPQNYPPNVWQPPCQPPSGPPLPQQFYGTPQNVYETLPGRSSSGYSAPTGGAEQYHYGGVSPYGNNPVIKPPQFSSPAMNPTAEGSYPQLPTARILPTTASRGSGSGSAEPGNRVPIDGVIDKVTNMGFPRDHVTATVQRLTEKGQAVDLNVILDKLMNDGEVRPSRGWIGR